MKRIYSTIIILIFFSLIVIANKGEKEQDNEKPILVYSVVEQTSDETGGNEIWVIKDGKIQNTGIEAYEIYWMLDQRDYDGDGLEEAYVAQSTGGSGYCPPFIVYFNKNTETFHKVEFKNLGVFLKDSVELWNGIWSFTGGTPSHYERYVFKSGRIIKVEDYTHPWPYGAEILLCLEPNTMFIELEAESGDKRNVLFDLDSDGQNEIIECEYMHGVNWEDFERDYKPTMNIMIHWSNGQNTDLTYDETWLNFIVLSTKTNGKNDLSSGKKGCIYKWDGRKYKLQ